MTLPTPSTSEPAPDAPPTELPPGYALHSVLVRRPGLLVARAEHGGESLVLRIEQGDSEETVSELAALSAVEREGLARLSDFGPLPGGGFFVARPWIEGAPLGEWARGRAAEEIGAAVAQLAAALEHVHGAGFVHGDLKPENVIASVEGRVVLCDFGLARRAGAEDPGGAAGTLYSVAPERLLGLPPDARSDLFSLGVLLHHLLVGRRPSAREFYGRFPRESFLDAVGTAAEELPLFARDLVEALTERDPSLRPGSAGEVARALAARLDLSLGGLAPAHAPGVPVELARGDWIARVVEAVSARPAPVAWASVPDAAEAVPLARALRLAAAAERRPLADAAEPEGLADAGAVDAWAAARAAEGATTPLLLAAVRTELWARRSIAALARACAASGRGLVVLSAEEPVAPELAWLRVDAPALPGDALAEYLEGCIEPTGAARALGHELARVCGGSAVRAGRVLAALAQEGALSLAGERARLRAEELPPLAALDAPPALTGLAPEEVAAARALLVAGAGSTDELGRLSGLAPRAAARALTTLGARRLAERRGPIWRAASVFEGGLAALASADEWRALHAGRAEELGATAGPTWRVLAHRALGGKPDAALLIAALEGLREEGCAELGLELVSELERWSFLAAPLSPARLAAERVLALCALGETERAAAELDSAPEFAGASDEAALEHARGRLTRLRQDPVGALSHLERAHALDPEGTAEAVVARLHVLYGRGADDEVLAAAAALDLEALPHRVRANARLLASLAGFRKGEVEAARAELEAQAAEARAGGDPAIEATVLLSLATVLRRAESAEASLAPLARAEELFDAIGRPEGLARARALRGGVLREVGDLADAGPVLESALAIRERLGDRLGADSVRGLLGLLAAERGHARAAIEELSAAARALTGASALRDAPLLAARAAEVRARIGESGEDSGAPDPDAVIDPRVLLALARAALLRGERLRAGELAERAERLGRSLSLAPVIEEAELIAAVIGGERAPRGEHLDARVLRALAGLREGGAGLDAARVLADELTERGRDDRAARLLLALAHHAPTAEERAAAREQARAALARCAAGLSAREALGLRRNLLGIPDPWPEDLEAAPETLSDDEEQEMEVLTLLDINHRLVQQQDLRTLLGVIVESALSVTGAERGFLLLEREGELDYQTALDSHRGGIDRPELEVSTSIVRQALGEMRSLRVSDAADDPLLAGAPSVATLELRSVLCAPFQVSEDLRGAIYVDHRLSASAFGARAEKLLELLSDQAALAIQQVRRIEEIRKLNARLSERVVAQESDLRVARDALRHVGLPAAAGGLVGTSPAMRNVRSVLERAAPTGLPVLIHGASGTGKELAARALHEQSNRREGPFVTENVAALPESLIESELFGYRKGAFTGAETDREGMFERASGGTLFLDEIGEMPLELQAKLLRVLETSEVRRLGDDRPRRIDVRLVAATNRDLSDEVRTGRFREDLYYRIAGLVIGMPSLAERTEDVPELVDHFLRMEEAKGGVRRSVSKTVLARLSRRGWPGNVRELRNELARLCVLNEGDLDDPELVSAPGPTAETGGGSTVAGEVLSMADLERRAITTAIERFGGDKRAAAKALGISLAKVYERLKRWREDDEAAGPKA